jgi:hypothetical protein
LLVVELVETPMPKRQLDHTLVEVRGAPALLVVELVETPMPKRQLDHTLVEVRGAPATSLETPCS